MIQILLGQLAAVLAVLQVIPYVWSILKGRTRPSRASYGIWSVIQAVQCINYIAAGATTTKWTLLVLTINAVGIFCLSFKYGVGGRNKFDIPCLLLAALAIVVWITTKNPATALYVCTFAGFLGYLPTIKKAYQWPGSENTLSWVMYVMAAFLNVCALTSLNPAIALPPLLGLGLSSTVVYLLVFPRRRFMGLVRQRYDSKLGAQY